jgi:ubiquinone/menaquinone biosynthesis C-methylase UbiE
MTMWIAELVGIEGSVSAVDNNEHQIAVASENARAAGLQNVFFHKAPADDTRLPHGSFDLVYSRFLMCHLTDPLAALKEMWGLLKPGGILVCEDFEMSAVGTCPPTEAYQRFDKGAQRCGMGGTVDQLEELLVLEAVYDAEKSVSPTLSRSASQVSRFPNEHSSFFSSPLRLPLRQRGHKERPTARTPLVREYTLD